MSTLWSNELELKLLECYHEESVLWDSKHPMYKDKNKNNNAWIRISSFMAIPVQDLKRKKDSLLSSYRKYKKLIKDSMHPAAGASEVYKPVWFAFDFIDSFLGDGQSKINTKDREEDPLQESEEDDNLTLPKISQIIETQTKSRRKNLSEMEQAGTYIKEAINTLNTLKGNDSQSENCDLYGRIIANKLRKMSEVEQAEIMYEIDGIFLRRLSHPQSLYDPSPSPSLGSYGIVKRPPSSESSYSEHIQETVYPIITSNEDPDIELRKRNEVTGNSKPKLQTKKIKRIH